MTKGRPRHGDVVQSDTPHTRRRLTTDYYYTADYVDSEDIVEVLINANSEIAMSNAMAAARQLDQIIIDAAVGNAHEGKDGATVAALPVAQSIAAGGTFDTAKLRLAKKKFDEDHVPKMNRICLINAAMEDTLLADTLFINADTNNKKPLVEGDVGFWLGFRLVSVELLPNSNLDAVCLGWRGVGAGVHKDVQTKVDQIPVKHHTWQILTNMKLGATRVEDKQVIRLTDAAS